MSKKENKTLKISTAFNKKDFKSDELKGTLTLAQEIGLNMIKLAGRIDDPKVPIRLGEFIYTPEDAKKKDDENLLFIMEIDLDKKIDIEEE